MDYEALARRVADIEAIIERLGPQKWPSMEAAYEHMAESGHWGRPLNLQDPNREWAQVLGSGWLCYVINAEAPYVIMAETFGPWETKPPHALD